MDMAVRTAYAVLISIVLSTAATQAPISAMKLPETLPDHPRLRVTDEGLEKILGYVNTNPDAMKYHQSLVAHGETILRQPPVVRPPPGPSGILETVRVALDRIYTMALLFRLTNNCNGTWLDRGWKELAAAANFSDWNPGHFLDVGEMTHAVAIGYDWFYKDLMPSQKKTLEDALAKKGFEPAVKAFEEKAFWTKYSENWNNVCNGGLIVGALCLLDDEEHGELAQKVLNLSLNAIPKAMSSYAPIGAWPEGAGYWDYATRYTVYAITSLKTALGHDHGLGNFTGFDRTAEFAIQHTGPSLQIFNWADAHATTGSRARPSDTAEMLYLATEYDHPDSAYFQRMKIDQGASSTAEDVISFAPNGSSADVQKLPKCQYYARRNVVVARSAWLDPMAAWIGFKGGDVSLPHSHMDLGSFVFEAKGERWAIDLGADSYALPEYFGHLRFTYYRLRNIGHNTLTFDDDNMGLKATSELQRVTCSDTGVAMSATANLTDAYAPSGVKSVSRSVDVNFVEKVVTIVDEIDIGESNAKTVTWSMHTYASIQIDASSKSAQLSKGDNSITVKTDSTATKCPDLEMSSEEVDLKPPQESTKGISKLMLKANAKTCSAISVLITY